jgi:SPP1 family predicted phage head-tail adaptor
MISEITLIGKVGTDKDALGQLIKTDDKTTVYADVESITQTEFMQAGAMGFKPELRFRVWRSEYSGENLVDYNEKRYSIYRTYEASDGRIELYAERRVGSGNDTSGTVDGHDNAIT